MPIGGTLASPWAGPRTLLRLALHRTRYACAVRTAWPGRRERPPTTPRHTRPYAIGGRSPKTYLREGACPHYISKKRPSRFIIPSAQ